MATINATTKLPAPPEQVWDIFSDPNEFENWLTIHQKWKSNVPERLTEGAQVSQVVSMLGMPNTIEWTVDEVVAPERLTISGEGMAAVQAEFQLSVTPDGNGGSTATLDAKFEGALVKGALEKAVVKESKNQLDQSMENLRELLQKRQA